MPTFIIIGAMKCGTTSLHRYLDAHPEIGMSHVKEVDFFTNEVRFARGVEWYASHFEKGVKVRGETSPNYSKYPIKDGVPERMHTVLPEARLIYLLRDPIERIFSQYNHVCMNENDEGPLVEALSDFDRSNYVNFSRYYMQLSRYLPYYPAERILIVTTEELRERRLQTLQKIFRFLGVDDTFRSPEFSNEYHRSSDKKLYKRFGTFLSSPLFRQSIRPLIPSALIRGYRRYSERFTERPELPPQLRAKLVACLQEDVRALREHTGRDFREWHSIP